MQYSTDDLVRLAKRDNNNIRPYLYVNPIQCKHIPADPEDMLEMCSALAEIVNKAYSEDRLFVIGFAETATGIAAGVCHYLDNVLFYQNTTRERKDGEDYLFFTESHSHATDQMLRTTGLRESIGSIDRIIIIDDEVTTGNTICKLLNCLKEEYDLNGVNYSIVSILNSMPEERIRQLNESGIECLFLLSIPFEYKKNCIKDIPYEKERHTVSIADEKEEVEVIGFNPGTNVRSVVPFADYEIDNKRFTQLIERIINDRHYRKLLVLGTEECMYPAIRLGKALEKAGRADDVKVHATTRSPIIASGVENYPLRHRYQIRSVYDNTRNTYIYNLSKYDKVIIVTDSTDISEGINDLICALKSVGNKNIMITRWHYYS